MRHGGSTGTPLPSTAGPPERFSPGSSRHRSSEMLNQTEPLDATALLGELRGVFGSGRTRGLSWRLEQLHGIERLCDEREAEITAALAEDLGRPSFDAWLADIASTKAEAAYARRHLKKWMR